ncbi:MAG TPA: hypothetical protein VHY37_02460, partial [Tepidisphaeraceae bacterium]|nr:hypothetical protein [Tepidisphaeraceae bacterium]
WVARMRESMARLTPEFSANRAVRQYTEQFYLPAASASRSRAADKGAMARGIAEAIKALQEKWNSARFGDLTVNTAAQEHAFDAQAYLGELDPQHIRIELFASAPAGSPPVRVEMRREQPLAGSANGFLYRARVPATRPASDFTPRMIPHIDAIAVPMELGLIRWQR